MAQNKVPNSGNTNDVNEAIKNARVEFPVTYELKAVIDASASDINNMKKISNIFKKLNISNSYVGNKKSSKGTYVSYNYEVTLQNRTQLEQLYVDLKEIPGLKFAL